MFTVQILKLSNNTKIVRETSRSITNTLVYCHFHQIKFCFYQSIIQIQFVILMLSNGGNRRNIKNYRPICLLSNIYKLFTKIITTRDENKPREQAGFRSKYSTTYHIPGTCHKPTFKREVLRIQHTTLRCVRGLHKDIWLSTNPSNIDIIARTRNGRYITCVHIMDERHTYIDSSVTVLLHRDWENQDQERSKTGGHHLTQAVHCNTGEQILYLEG